MASNNNNSSWYNRVRFGNAGPAQLAFALLDAITVIEEQNKTEGNVFHQTILRELAPQKKVLKELCTVFDSYYQFPFMHSFTRGPPKFENKRPENLFLADVKFPALANMLVDRFDYAVHGLFRIKDPSKWEPHGVTYQGRADINLCMFATHILSSWQKMDEDFGEAFGLALKNAVIASKAEGAKKRELDEKDKPAKGFQSKKAPADKKAPAQKAQADKKVPADKKAPAQKAQADKKVVMTRPIPQFVQFVPRTVQLASPDAVPTKNVWKERLEAQALKEAAKEEVKEETEATETVRTDAQSESEETVDDHQSPDDKHVVMDADVVTANTSSKEEKEESEWKTVTKSEKKTVNVEVLIDGKPVILQGRVLKNGKLVAKLVK